MPIGIMITNDLQFFYVKDIFDTAFIIQCTKFSKLSVLFPPCSYGKYSKKFFFLHFSALVYIANK